MFLISFSVILPAHVSLVIYSTLCHWFHFFSPIDFFLLHHLWWEHAVYLFLFVISAFISFNLRCHRSEKSNVTINLLHIQCMWLHPHRISLLDNLFFSPGFFTPIVAGWWCKWFYCDRSQRRVCNDFARFWYDKTWDPHRVWGRIKVLVDVGVALWLQLECRVRVKGRVTVSVRASVWVKFRVGIGQHTNEKHTKPASLPAVINRINRFS